MTITELTIENLKKLPLRAIVALATRCARRVEPLAQLPDDHPACEGRRAAVAEALALAERFAMGEPCPHPDAVVRAVDVSRRSAGVDHGSEIATAAAAETVHAVAAVCLAYDPAEPPRIRHTFEETDEVRKVHQRRRQVTLDISALNAFTAAADGVLAIGARSETYVSAALNDYDRLVSLELGEYPDLARRSIPRPEARSDLCEATVDESDRERGDLA